MLKMKDKLFTGAVSGFIGAGVVGLISDLLERTGISDFSYMDIAGSLVLPQSIHGTFTWMLVGWLNNFIIGIILGIVLTYILAMTGKDYGIFKGALFGVIWWFIVSVIIQPNFFDWGRIDNFGHLAVCFFRDVLFGIIASYIIVKYADLKNPV